MKYTFLFIAALSLFACNNAEKSTKSTLPTTPNGLSGIQSSAANGSDTSGQMLNPVHGAPGHDCALPVGAPLKSASANVNTADTSIKSVNAPQAAAPSQKPKTNPAHGMPFHDCALAVGAPLS